MEFFDFARRGGIIDLTSGLNEEKPDASFYWVFIKHINYFKKRS